MKSKNLDLSEQLISAIQQTEQSLDKVLSF